MRRRGVEQVLTASEIPAEFAIGRCIEVWASEVPSSQKGPHGTLPLSAYSNFTHARRAWREERQIHSGGREILPTRSWHSLYSVEFLIINGRPQMAEEIFAAADMTFDDIPRLRQAAMQWLGDSAVAAPRTRTRARTGARRWAEDATTTPQESA